MNDVEEMLKNKFKELEELFRLSMELEIMQQELNELESEAI